LKNRVGANFAPTLRLGTKRENPFKKLPSSVAAHDRRIGSWFRETRPFENLAIDYQGIVNLVLGQSYVL
jgi:hypothetical protein